MTLKDDVRSTLIKPSTVRLERLLPGPVERVWAYLVDSKKRATWLAGGEIELKIGGRVELIFDNDQLSDDVPHGGGPRTFEGRVTRLEPLRALAYTWIWDGKETEVLYELTAKGTDVLLTIVHRLPEGGGMIKGVGAGWAVHSGLLADQLNGVKPRPFWSTHDRLMKEFETAQ